MLQLATVGDWDEVRRLSVQIHDLHAAWRPDIYFHSETPYPKEQYLDDIRKRLVYVAKIDTVVVGYVVLSFVTKEGPGTITCKSLRLDSICVDQGLRGHGIGKQMVEEVRALARAFGCRQLLLGVHPENDRAVGFYQKCGFQIRTINMDMKL